MASWRGKRSLARLGPLLAVSFWLGMVFQRNVVDLTREKIIQRERAGNSDTDPALTIQREVTTRIKMNQTAILRLSSGKYIGKRSTETEALTGVREISSKDELLHCEWLNRTGWYPSYNQHDYRYLINPTEKCSFTSKLRTNITLLILISSGLANRDRREAQRKTWIRWSIEHKLPITTLFLFGATEDHGVMEEIRAESELHGDIVQEDFIDSYHNLTLKTIMAFKWAALFCRHVDFVMKMDDDCVVHVENIVRDLASAPSKFRSSCLMGSPCVGYRPFRDPKNRYCIPNEIFPSDVYQTFPQGAGYVFSSDMAGKLYQASKETLAFPFDDVFVGMLLKLVGVEMRARSSFFLSYYFKNGDKYLRSEDSLLALQKGYLTWDVSPATIEYVWKAIVENKWPEHDRFYHKKCNRTCIENAGYLP